MLKQIILSVIIFSFFLNLNFSVAQQVGVRGQAPIGSIDGQPINVGVRGSINLGGPDQPSGPAQGVPRGRGVSNFGSTSSGCDFLDAKGDRPTFGNVGCIINDFTNNVVQMLGTLFGAMALVAFFWGLYLFIFHGASDPTKMKEGKSLMGYGLLALFVMISVWGIVRLAQNIFGVKNETQIVLPSICVGNNCEKGTSSSGKELETSDAGKGEKKNTGTGESNTSVPATPKSKGKGVGETCNYGQCAKPLTCEGTTLGLGGTCRTAAQDLAVQENTVCGLLTWCGTGLTCSNGFCKKEAEKIKEEGRNVALAACNPSAFKPCEGSRLSCSSFFGGFCRDSETSDETIKELEEAEGSPEDGKGRVRREGGRGRPVDNTFFE